MSAETRWSLGVDLGRSWSPAAVAATDGSVTMIDAVECIGSQAVDVVECVRALLAVCREQHDISPTRITLAMPDGASDERARFVTDVAARLGVPADDVRVIGEAVARKAGRDHPSISTEATEAAVGAAVLGLERDERGLGAVALGGGAAGAVAAGSLGMIATGSGVGEAATVLGPAGVPLATQAAAGAAGVPFNAAAAPGAAGVPFSPQASLGTQGVPVGTGSGTAATGIAFEPSAGTATHGVPLATAARGLNRTRLAVVIGTAVVVATAAIVYVASADDPQKSAASTVSTTAVAPVVVGSTEAVHIVETVAAAVTEPATTAPALETAAVTAAPQPSDVDTSTSTTVAPAGTVVPDGAACMAGTWIGDNETVGQGFVAAAGDGVTLVGITGTVTVVIGPDGAVLTTYDNWQITASIGSITTVMTVTGTETGQVTFGADGIYTVGAMEIGSQVSSVANGLAFQMASPSSLFHGSSTYTCAPDGFTLNIPDGSFVATFTRSA